MIMFGLLPWFSLMAAGLVASVVLLFWGLKSGQFADQERARYLPLRGEEIAMSGPKKRHAAREIYALAGFITAAGIALAVCLGIALLKQSGG